MRANDLIAFFGSRFRENQTAAEAMRQLAPSDSIRMNLIMTAWVNKKALMSEISSHEFSIILKEHPEALERCHD